jgi:predicted DCC family thiol-disulfide oxidoreductase YuxK
MCFFGRNVLTEDPSFSFVSLLLLLLMIVPEGEPLSLGRLWSSCREDWYMPYWIYHTILFAIGLGFSISGLDKLQGQGWVTGDAMFFLYNLQLAYDTWLVALLKQQPTWLIALQTWGAMFVMLIALPLLSLPRTRALMWLLLFSMFAFVLIILDLKQVVFGVLLALLFIFDARWIPGRRATHVELFYDTSCKLCEGYRKFIEAENELQTNVIPFSSISTLPKQYDLGSDSIVLIVEDSAYYRSDAILMQFRLLGGIWLLLSYVGVLVPKKLRDALYNFVARNRYRWFGRCGCEGPEIV